jgi:hypothetical protein
MSDFFTETMTGLLQAVAIERGDIKMTEVAGMPAKTYRIETDERSSTKNKEREQLPIR